MLLAGWELDMQQEQLDMQQAGLELDMQQAGLGPKTEETLEQATEHRRWWLWRGWLDEAPRRVPHWAATAEDAALGRA